MILVRAAWADAWSATSCTLATLLPLGAAGGLARLVLDSAGSVASLGSTGDVTGTLSALFGPLLLGFALLTAVVAFAGATSGYLRAHPSWARLWDQSVGLPQSVITTHELCATATANPWTHALMAAARNLPQPDPDALRRLIPLARPFALASSVLVSIVLVGLAALEASPSAGPSTGPFDGPLPTADDRANAARAEGPTTSGDREPLAHQSSRHGDRTPAAIRSEITERVRSAEILERFEDTRPIADWLLRGGEPPRDLHLGTAARARLSALAAEITARQPDLAGRIARLAVEGDTTAEARAAPAADANEPVAAEVLLASVPALTQLLRSEPTRAAASFTQRGPNDGGLDPIVTSETNADAPAQPMGDPDPTPLPLPQGRALGEGATLPRDPSAPRDPLAPEPPSMRLMARPDIETHWLPVMDRYHELRQRRRAEQDARTSPPSLGKEAR